MHYEPKELALLLANRESLISVSIFLRDWEVMTRGGMTAKHRRPQNEFVTQTKIACVHSTPKSIDHQGCTSTSDISHRPMSLQNVRLIFQWRGQMSHYFPVSAVDVRLFFVTLSHHIADPVTGWSPTV